MSTEATLNLCRAVREAAEKATPGPWDSVTSEHQWPGYPRAVIRYRDGPNDIITPSVSSPENADLIILTRTAAPLLAELVEALLAEREAQRECGRRWHEYKEALRQQHATAAHVAELLQKAGELCPPTPNPH